MEKIGNPIVAGHNYQIPVT